KPVEMCLHSAPRHFQLAGNFSVVTSLQKQVHDLLFARTEPNSLLLHSTLPFLNFLVYGSPIVQRLDLSKRRSTHVAILGTKFRFSAGTLFSTGTCRQPEPLPNSEVRLRKTVWRCFFPRKRAVHQGESARWAGSSPPVLPPLRPCERVECRNPLAA